MSDLVERLRKPWTDYYTVENGKMTGLLEEAADEIKRLREEVDRLESDELAYRLSLGYEIPANHGGLLSDGTQPVNGIAQAYAQQYERLQAVVHVARSAVCFYFNAWESGESATAKMQDLDAALRTLDGEP